MTCYDPDALTAGGFWHWAVYDIPSSVDHLPAGTGDEGGGNLPVGAQMLADDTGRHCFLGAAPAPGSGNVHRCSDGAEVAGEPGHGARSHARFADADGGRVASRRPYRALVRDLLTAGR
ncbi:hypothetical protein ABZ479_04580 [Streptomyces sp. NPDC005722]